METENESADAQTDESVEEFKEEIESDPSTANAGEADDGSGADQLRGG